MLEQQGAELIGHVHVDTAVPGAFDAVLLSAHPDVGSAVVGMKQLHIHLPPLSPELRMKRRRERGYDRPRRLWPNASRYSFPTFVIIPNAGVKKFCSTSS